MEAEKYDGHQRRWLKGFTEEELQNVGAIAVLDPTSSQCSLKSPIHSIFSQGHWVEEEKMPKHRGRIPTWGDDPGFWLVC